MESLSDVRRLLEDRRDRLTRIEVQTDAIGLDDDGRLRVDGQSFALGPDARKVITGWAKIPDEFFANLRPEIQKFLFARLYADSAADVIRAQKLHRRSGLIVEDGSRCVGIVDPSLAHPPGLAVLTATLAAKPDNIDETQLEVPHCRLNGEVHVSVISRTFKTEVRTGDVVYAGIDIRHSDHGAFATQIESYMYRLVCTNGMLMKVCRHIGTVPSRLRRPAAHNPDRMMHQIQAMARAAWTELDAKIEAVRLLAEERVDKRADLVRSIAEKLRFPERLVKDIVQALEEDEHAPSGTLWDIIGAVSRVGTHSDRLSSATRRFLQELSGDLIFERVHRCPTCGRSDLRQRRLLPRR